MGTLALTVGLHHTQRLHRTSTSALQLHQAGSALWMAHAISPGPERPHSLAIRTSVLVRWQTGLVAATSRTRCSGEVSADFTCCSMEATSHPPITNIGAIPVRLKEPTHMQRMLWAPGLWCQTATKALGPRRRLRPFLSTTELQLSYGAVKSQASSSTRKAVQHTSQTVWISSTRVTHLRRAV